MATGFVHYVARYMLQADEEIYEIQQYFGHEQEVPDAELPQIVAHQLADYLVTPITNLLPYLGSNVHVFGISVTSPVIDGVGPCRYDHGLDLDGGAGEVAVTDQIFGVIQISGATVGGDPVVNRKQLSGFPADMVIGNRWDDTFIEAVNDDLESIFPLLTVHLSAIDVDPLLWHKPAPLTEPTWGIPTEVKLNPVCGSNIYRKGNTPQKRRRPAAT